jgi:hypothetical protein
MVSLSVLDLCPVVEGGDAELELPHAFASPFAPTQLHAAVALYRREFRPSQQLRRPM